MSWVLFSVLAALIWSISSIIDKFVLSKWVRNPNVPVIFTSVIGLIGALFIYLLHGFSPLSYLNIGLAFISGASFIISCILYFKAVQIEEISRVVPMFYLSPLFVMIMAAIFLGEVFGPLKYLGIFLLVIGAIIISSKNLKMRFGKAFWLMITCSLLGAAGTVITKYLLNFADFWTIFSYTRIGTVFALIPIFYLDFPDLISTIKKHGKKVVGVISFNTSLNLVGVLFITIALSMGFVTLVNALSSVQPFFVLLFTVILSRFYPRILKEEIGKSTILIKVIAIILMFVGAILISQ